MHILSTRPRSETSIECATSSGTFLIEYRTEYLAVFAPTLPDVLQVVEGSEHFCAHTYHPVEDPDLLVDHSVPLVHSSVYPGPLARALPRWREREDVIGTMNRLLADEVVREFLDRPEAAELEYTAMLAELTRELEEGEDQLVRHEAHVRQCQEGLEIARAQQAEAAAAQAAKREWLGQLASREAAVTSPS